MSDAEYSKLRPSDHEALAPALAMIQDLELATAHFDWELIVPEHLLKGVTKAWGHPVLHMPGIDCVYVARRVEIRDKQLFTRELMGGPREP